MARPGVSPRTFRPEVELLEERSVPAAPPVAWFQHGTGGGGALYSPSIGLTNANELYIASDMSNLFYSSNFGASFSTVAHQQIQGNHYARVQFTNDANIRYCLDYSTLNGVDQTRPLKSTNGGTTWTTLAGDPTAGGAFYLFVDPNNPNSVIVTDYTRLYFSNNGGISFSQKYVTSNTSTGLHVGGVFFDGSNIYVGTNLGLLTSVNGGTSFTMNALSGVPAGQGIIGLAGARQGGTTRLFAVVGTAANIYAGITGADFNTYTGIYTLDIGSATWVNRSAGIAAGHFPFFTGAALADINTVYVAGGSSAGTPIVYKSTNAGATWQSVFLTTNNQNIQTGWQGQGGDRGWSYGEYVLGLAVAPGDASRAVITDLGGAHGTSNGGTLWQALYVNPADLNPAGQATGTGKNYRSSGLDNTTSWQVFWADPNVMLIANSDVRGQRSTNAGQAFNYGYSGHTDNSMYRVVRHSNGNLYAATSTVHDLYQTTYLQDSRIDPGGGKVLFSTNNGQTWQTMRDFTDPVIWVATDPTNANRLYAAVVNSTVGGIYVTNNVNAGASATWTKLTNPPRTEGHPFNIVVLNDGTLVVTYCARRNSSGTFTASSGVFVSTDGGTTWQDRSHANMVYYTKDIVVDPTDATQNTWYVGVWSGWGGPPNNLGGLYRSTNRGQSWTRLTTHHRVSSITIDPTDGNTAYLTTETQGLWHTTNLAASSPTFTQVAGFPFRQPERVFFNPHNPNEIWVSTFGGGVWRGVFSTTPGTLAPTAIKFFVDEGIGNLVVTFQRTGGTFGQVSLDVFTYTSPIPNAAQAGLDYVPTAATLVFGPNDTVKTFSIPIIDDAVVEPLETFGLGMTNPTGGAELRFRTAVIRILDNDTPGGAQPFGPPPAALQVLGAAEPSRGDFWFSPSPPRKPVPTAPPLRAPQDVMPHAPASDAAPVPRAPAERPAAWLPLATERRGRLIDWALPAWLAPRRAE